jgi:hypothetical protein
MRKLGKNYIINIYILKIKLNICIFKMGVGVGTPTPELLINLIKKFFINIQYQLIFIYIKQK